MARKSEYIDAPFSLGLQQYMDLENHLQSLLNLQYPCVLWRGLAKLSVAVETTIWWMKVDEDYRRLHNLYCWLLHMMCYDCFFLMIILPLCYCGLFCTLVDCHQSLNNVCTICLYNTLLSRDHPSWLTHFFCAGDERITIRGCKLASKRSRYLPSLEEYTNMLQLLQLSPMHVRVFI